MDEEKKSGVLVNRTIIIYPRKQMSGNRKIIGIRLAKTKNMKRRREEKDCFYYLITKKISIEQETPARRPGLWVFLCFGLRFFN
jgi:hypothetical protein